MANHRRENDSGGPNAEATSHNTVFVDTSLDTHLVMIISSSDTVSDFKKKILLQHTESFPRIGGVRIHSLQVKRQGHFYHLPDSMLVSSAFDGFKRTWFLFVEASCSQDNDKEQPSHEPDASENVSLLLLQNHSQGNEHNLLADNPVKLTSEKVAQAVQASPRNFSREISRDIEMEVGHRHDDCEKELSTNENMALPGATLENNIRVSQNAASFEDDNSRDGNKTTDGSRLEELLSAAKKRKIEDIENVGLTTKKHKVENKKDPMAGASGKVPSDLQTRQTDVRGELCDTLSSDANWMSISGAQKTSQSGPHAEQSEKLGRKEVYPDQADSTTGEHVSKQERVPSLQEVDKDDLLTGLGSKKGKRKQKKTLLVPHDQIATSKPISGLHGSVFNANLDSEAPEANKNEGPVELELNNEPEVMLSKKCKPLDQGEADGTNEESIPLPNFGGPGSPTEAVGSVQSKSKKMRTKKKAPGIQTYSTGEETTIAGAVSSTVVDLAPRDHIMEKIVNDKSMLSVDDCDQNNIIEAQEASKGSIVSPNISGANKVAEADNSGTRKRERRNSKKSAAKLQEKSDVVNLQETSLRAQGVVLDVEMNDRTTKKKKVVSNTETELKNDGELPFGHRPEVNEANEPLNSGKETVDGKESGLAEISLDGKHGMEAGKSGGSRKKKRVKKPSTTNDDFSSMEHSNPVNDSPAKHFEGNRGSSFRHGAEVISSKASKTLDLGEATVNGSESVFAVQPLDNEDSLKAGKSGGDKKKKKAKKRAEGKETSKEESRNASTSGASKGNEASKSKEIASLLPETDQTWENAKDLDENLREAKDDQTMETNALQDMPVKEQATEVQHLEQDEADKEQENSGNIKKKVKKKTKRNQNTAAETQSNSKIKEENISVKDSAASGDKLGVGDNPYYIMNTSVSAETRTGNQSAVLELMLEKNAGVKSKFLHLEQALKGADSSEVPSYHTVENNLEQKPETVTDIENTVETSKAGDEEINFRHYFVSGEHQSEGTSADNLKEALQSTEAKRKAKKPNVISEGTFRSNQQRQNKSNTNGNQVEESSSDANGKEDVPLTHKKTSKASGNAAKASNSCVVDKVKTPWKAPKPVVTNGSGSSRTIPSSLEENNGSVTASGSSSSTKGSKGALRDTSNAKQQSGFNNDGTSARKLSRRDDGDVVSSQQGKSLLTSAGAIFCDGSSESSGDENGRQNSDASTRTPSDSSSSSGYSVGESDLSQDSKGNGSKNERRKDSGCKSTLTSKVPGPADLTMDMILRSSKRFKKAKLTASQSQEADTESQPVDFVPDSQAN